jgi:endonuclease/exonuclease/phosphatase family metal-dependent hydrolase
LPLLIGGDFNIIQRKEEKTNNNFNTRWPFLFNAIIESLDLREIALSGRQFTWASRHTIPTYKKLDRILASVDWENKFPLVSVRALTRTGSDHTPLLTRQTGRLRPARLPSVLSSVVAMLRLCDEHIYTYEF